MNNEIMTNAKAEYKTAGEQTRKSFEKVFGKELFNETWMELWQKFCEENKLTLALPYPNPSNPDEEYLDAHFMMMHIIRKKRSKKPDWNNSSEYKYAPWFDMRTDSGSRFAYGDFVYWCAYTFVGSRLCIPSDKKLMEQIAKDYQPIYEKIMVEP